MRLSALPTKTPWGGTDGERMQAYPLAGSIALSGHDCSGCNDHTGRKGRAR
ncbi:hypothetical protein [Oleidesulfovibrio sp.]|uniref:hypothetical protein n=1 Tax=Oleidesulfovibrio sp. TaxID=2909707 RepID=UPI003A8B9B2C